MPRPHRALAAAAVAGLVLVAGCSSSGRDITTAAGPTTPAADAAASTTTAVPGAATTEPVPSSGCGATKVRSVVQEKQYLDDSDRWWLLTTPLEHDGSTPLPLVIDFHGLSEGAEVHAQMTELSTYGDRHGFIVVTPQGTGSPTRWQVSPDPATNPDLVFTADMLDQLEADLCVDTSRVYATGLSNGAFMSSAVACAMSDRFAAVAPVAGLIFPKPCKTSRPVPILAFHGTADPILLFNGGIGDRLGNVLDREGGGSGTKTEATIPNADLNGAGYPESARNWAAHDGCGPTFTDKALTDTVTQRTWPCPDGVEVIFDIVEGGGHSWPGSAFSEKLPDIVGTTDMSVDANDLIWAFFQRHALPAG